MSLLEDGSLRSDPERVTFMEEFSKAEVILRDLYLMFLLVNENLKKYMCVVI